MRIRESEQDRQAYLTRRMNEADIATREYVNQHAREIGVAEGEERGLIKGEIKGEIKRIHLAQRVCNQPLTPAEELEKIALPELTALGDRLEQQLLSKKDTP